jgi:hypothetical protein
MKKRRTFMIEPDILEKLRAIKDRTGLSESEQVRQGIRWWLESREWPLKGERSDADAAPEHWRPHQAAAPRGPRTRR